jgi:uncharacterized protein YdaU (DUF1376 family)
MSAATARSPLYAEWFCIDRWKGSSAALMPLEARGLYREMLTAAWARGGHLPNDLEQVQRLIGATDREWRRSWPIVAVHWRIEGAYLVNETQQQVYADSLARYEAATAKASKGGQAAAARRRARGPRLELVGRS